ncbi:unnamed protein product [Bemisia tabaci]|uniref:Ionotropic receptor n=1 Tax=Bemisia tabaci TaxID=7038 RepID=A0A9P0G3Y2_BEMTA|nr:unnamed protein product [Bemisia tabaci]
MSLSFRQLSSMFLLIISMLYMVESLQISASEEIEDLTSIAVTLCKKTAALSKKDLFYVLSINPNFPVPNFIRSLFQNMIWAFFVTHHRLLEHLIVGSRPKNLIVFVNDLDEIPSLILDSSSNAGKKFDPAIPKSPRLKRYCIRNELYESADNNKTCDFELDISQAYLTGASLLSDPLCKHTIGLYANSVWNSDNYIIFMLPNRINGKDAYSINSSSGNRRLKFLFGFFWRFFRGFRTIICLGRFCYAYDPFRKSIQEIDATGDAYFTFVPNLRGIVLSIGFVQKEEVLVQSRDLSTSSPSVLFEVVGDLQQEYRSELIVYPRWRDIFIDHFEDAHRTDFDMLVFDGSLAPREDFSTFESSAAVGSCSYCFAAPHSGLVPQSFLPFKCFSFQTWVVIVTAVLLLFGAFYAFYRSQCALFHRLYSDQEQRVFRHTSVALYLYQYLIVGSSSRLLLGRLMTGKILFLLVSFFILIIVTLFQSKMTTLLAKQLRYPELDTLEDLANSALLIQTPDLEASESFLQDHPLYEFLRDKLSERYYYDKDMLERFYSDMLDFNNTFFTLSLDETNPFARKIKELRSSLSSVLESDVFELTVVNLNKFGGNIHAGEVSLHPGIVRELHLLRECILTYPLTLQIKRNSYLSEIVIRRIAAYIEMGLHLKIVSHTMYTHEDWFNTTFKQDDDEADSPTKFTMQNLQPAFVSLVIGWFSSSIVFAVELVIDVLKGNTASKFIRCVEKCIRPSSLWT